jgi:hypothetical protein
LPNTIPQERKPLLFQHQQPPPGFSHAHEGIFSILKIAGLPADRPVSTAKIGYNRSASILLAIHDRSSHNQNLPSARLIESVHIIAGGFPWSAQRIK